MNGSANGDLAVCPLFPPAPACTPQESGSYQGVWAHYAAGNNRFSNTQQAIGGVGYDGAGNILNDGVNQYLYDGDGRICAVASSGTGAPVLTGYIYNAEGERVSKGSITVWSCDPATNGFKPLSDYVVGQSGEQMTEMGMDPSGSMAWQHTNVYAFGQVMATYDNAGLHFYLNDPLGTRRAQTDYAGVLEQTCLSLPFGDELICTSSQQYPTEHHFTGKERDTESGNDYFGARYYASSMGRFMSPDYQSADDDDVPDAVPNGVLTNPQTLNLYSYVQNNPLSKRDYDGHASWQNCADGSGAQCWVGDYNGEHNNGLFWNAQSGQWQGTDPTATPNPSLSDMPGMAFTGLTRVMLGDPYGFQQMGYAYARTFAAPFGAGALVPKPTGTPLGRPAIVPKDWIEKPGSKGKGGTEYIDPNNPHNRVRVMPGNPDSPNPAQREPYMVVKQNGQYLDSNLNEVKGDSVDAHIPVDTPMDSPFIP